MDRTPASTLNLSVSWESIAVPEYQPFTERRPEINIRGETCPRQLLNFGPILAVGLRAKSAS